MAACRLLASTTFLRQFSYAVQGLPPPNPTPELLPASITNITSGIIPPELKDKLEGKGAPAPPAYVTALASKVPLLATALRVAAAVATALQVRLQQVTAEEMQSVAALAAGASAEGGAAATGTAGASGKKAGTGGNASSAGGVKGAAQPAAAAAAAGGKGAAGKGAKAAEAAATAAATAAAVAAANTTAPEEIAVPPGPDPAKVAAAHQLMISEVAACVAELQQRLRLLAGGMKGGSSGAVRHGLTLLTVPCCMSNCRMYITVKFSRMC